MGKGNNEELVNVDARNAGVADVVQVTYGETDPPEFLSLRFRSWFYG